MKNEKLQAELVEMICEQLTVEEMEVIPSARFEQDLGADSLDAVEMLMALEELLNIEISDDDAEKLKTVGDVYSYVEQRGF